MSTRRPIFENLESRQLFAADITATLSRGNLYINEVANNQNGFDQAVQISSLTNGKVRVAGITSQNPADTRASRINGLAFADYSVSGAIYVNFKDGGDVVKLVNLNAKDVEISTGGVTWQWPDSDRVEVRGGNLRTLVINTGIGSDTVKMQDTMIGVGMTGSSYLIVNTGDGADSIDVSNLRSMSPVAFQAGNDADTLAVTNSTIHNALKVDLGEGNDQFRIQNTVPRFLEVKAGLGSDVGALDSVYATYHLNVDMGEGDDTLVARSIDGASGLLDGGLGKDTLHLNNSSNNLGKQNWELLDDALSAVIDEIAGAITLRKGNRLAS